MKYNITFNPQSRRYIQRVDWRIVVDVIRCKEIPAAMKFHGA